ncbi:MAG: tyrosine-type recombinase/integrase [Candidatus Neomarinimicrobiota bacterium]|nr:tyrosine-type recombinase/integrase [Candidatus Neomarinimicrobiota bacterium]
MKVDLKNIKTEFLSYLKSERGFSGHTLESYSNDIGVFIDYCSTIFLTDNIDLDLINAKTIRNFIGIEKERKYVVDGKKKKYETKTVNRRLAVIKSLFKYLYNFEKIKDNPAMYLRTQKTEKNLTQFVREDDIVKLMEKPLNMNIPDKRYKKDNKKKKYITNKLEGFRDQAILEMLYATGLRLSELLSINICDIDRKSELVKVMGKGGKERIVPIGKVALNSIESYLKKLGKSIRSSYEDPLFVNKKGKRLPKRTLQRRIKKYLEVTMGGGTVHTLRHTFATHLINSGADILTVKELLGHSSLSSTQHYTRLNLEKIKKVYQEKHPHGK